MLKRVLIENYRSCLRTTLDLHRNLSVLIGPNGSGKTNILHGILLLHRLAHETSLSPRTRRAETAATPRIKALFNYRGTRAELSASVSVYTDRFNDDLISSRQKWSLSNAKHRASFAFPMALIQRPSSVPLAYFRTVRAHRISVLEFENHIPSWTRPVIKNIADFCQEITYYGASQFTNPSSCPSSFQIEEDAGKVGRLIRLRGHEKVLYSMYSAKKRGSKGYAQFMDIVGPAGLRLIDGLSFREVKTSSSDYEVRVGGKVVRRKRSRLLIVPQFRIRKQRLSPNQLSEGTFKTLALLFHVITDEARALLIEEPEVCVHHGLLSSILELIKSSSHKKQIILSTHSDYVLDQVEPDNVFQIKFDELRGTIAQHIPKAMTAKQYSALREYLSQEGNLGEYWREGGLGDRP